MGPWEGLEPIMEFITKCQPTGHILGGKKSPFFVSPPDRNFTACGVLLIEDE